MGFFSKLFGNLGSTSKTPAVAATEYNGYQIYPEPISEGGQYRIAGRICKYFGDEEKTYAFIRSDLLSSLQDAETLMVTKAKMFIDQTGDSMFDQ